MRHCEVIVSRLVYQVDSSYVFDPNWTPYNYSLVLDKEKRSKQPRIAAYISVSEILF